MSAIAPAEYDGVLSRNPVNGASTADDLVSASTVLPRVSAHARGGDPLGSPPPTVTGLGSGIAIPYPVTDSTLVATGPIELGRGFLEVISTSEQIAEARMFFADWKRRESNAQRNHAKARSTVFSLMQYRVHPETGAVLWTQEQFDALIDSLEAEGILDKYAAIWQDSDTDDDGAPVPLHMHAAIKLKPQCEKSVRWISDRATMPASRIETPKEYRTRKGGAVEVGPLAAERAFFDFCEYLTHEKYFRGGEADA